MQALKKALLGTLLLAQLPLLAACIAHQQYRDRYSLCTSSDPATECRAHSLQAFQNPGNPAGDYWLGFVELDDQGQLWDRAQLQALLDLLYETSAERDLLMMVFVHGWKHSAAPGDENIAVFRKTLERLSLMESSTNPDPRQVVGVYLGWRGGSVSTPIVENLTFWDRKKTAHKVGNGGATEVLSQLELLKKARLGLAENRGRGPITRLIVVGHSFGGAVVYTAVHQLLENSLVQTRGPDGVASDAVGFADLVVLINPAFEAQNYASLHDMSTARGTYFEDQLPVLAVLTSESDYATKYAFPAGRWFSTVFEKTRPVERFNPVIQQPVTIDQGRANRLAVGHFAPYQTHYLEARKEVEDVSDISFDLAEEVQSFVDASAGWQADEPGSVIDFNGSVLSRSTDSAGRNPYLNILVDERLIRDHNDLSDPRIGSFVRQLVLISAQSRDLQERAEIRARVMEAYPVERPQR